MDKIISKNSSKFKLLKKLDYSKYRIREKCFKVEGLKFLSLSVEPREVFISERFAKSKSFNRLKNKNVTIISDDLFGQLSGQVTSQGVISIFDFKDPQNVNNNSIIVLDEIRDPGNLGTILRTAEFFGFKDIVKIGNVVDQYNPKVVRASMGAVVNLNFLHFNKEDCFKFLRDRGYTIVSSVVDGYDLELQSFKEKGKYALILGNESRGVSDYCIKNCDIRLGISRKGRENSLNVAVAAAIMISSLSS